MIDIVMTTFRNVEKLKICLRTIIERTKYVDFKLYLWANEPDDDVKQTIHDSMFVEDIMFTDKIVPIYNDSNDGSFSSNNNEAASEGDGEYILFANDDLEPLNDQWLLNMKTVLDSNQKVGAVGALLLYPDKKHIQHCGVMFSQRTNNLPFHILYKQQISKVSQYISVPRQYQAVTAACMLVRRKDFEELGGFSEDFYYGFEDVAFCLDIQHKLGKTCVYTPNAQLIHHEGISGTFKQHPKLKENIAILKTKYKGKFFNDEMFYMNTSNYMVYRNPK